MKLGMSQPWILIHTCFCGGRSGGIGTMEKFLPPPGNKNQLFPYPTPVF
jgi:hypothetical protein